MKFWFFWFVSIWFYASAVFASVTDDLNGKSPHEILFRAHLRKVADLNLRDRYNPTIFVSYSWDSEEYKRRIQTVCEDLEKAGIPVNQILLDQWANRPGGPYDLHQLMERIPYSDIVMLFGTPELKRKYEERKAHPEDAGIVSHEINLLRNRVVAKGVKGVMNAWFDGEFYDLFPQGLHHIIGRKLDDYSLKFFELLWDLYQTIDPHPRNSIMEIKGNFAIRRERLRATSNQTEFQSANGFFPHSLIAHNAFLDRTNRRGLSYLDVIFEELFMNEDDRHYATLTLCARANPQEVTLSGLGGVGKTTLATEFAHKYGMFYDLVYWITGGSREELLRSYLSLLKLLEIPIPEQRGERDENYSARIVRLINENLPKYHKHYLLVVDNIEDPALVADLSPPQGHVLYTSRNNDWMRQLDIDVLKREESIALLLQLTGLSPSLTDQAGELAEELGDLPLALAQAAAYIKQQRLSTFEAYLDIYRTSQAILLSRQQIQSSLNGKYGREAIVMTTWNTTMQKLSTDAQQLMEYFAYVKSDSIPIKPFEEIENYERMIDNLVSYSMIKREKHDSISVHRLVQLVERIDHQKNHRDLAVLNELLDKWLRFWAMQNEKHGLGTQFTKDFFSSPLFRDQNTRSDIMKINGLYLLCAPHIKCMKSYIQDLRVRENDCSHLMENWETLNSFMEVRSQMYAMLLVVLKKMGRVPPEMQALETKIKNRVEDRK
jgi:hypothetical protein